MVRPITITLTPCLIVASQGTTGVLMLACTKALARELSQQFRARAIEKTYLALVLGGGSDFSVTKGLISGSLSFDDGRVQLSAEEEAGSKPALTTWEVLAFSVRPFLDTQIC